MTATIAEIHEILDRTARYNAEAAHYNAEAAHYNAEAARFNAAAEAHLAEYKALLAESARLAVERDAKWQRDMEAMQKSFDAEHKKTEAVARKIANDLHCQWGRLVESLCENQVVPLLRSRGIEISRVTERQSGRLASGEQFEIDITAVNGDTIALIEVKTTLRPDDVKDFVATLGHAREMFPEWRNCRFLGGVAFLHQAAKAAQFAQKHGLFTILATGSGAVITNDEKFTPKEW